MREGRLNGHEAHVELSHQQLVLVLTLIRWRGGERRKKQRIMAERRENRQRSIDCDLCHIRTKMCRFLHQAFICLHICVRRYVITVTSFKKKKFSIKKKENEVYCLVKCLFKSERLCKKVIYSIFYD